MNMGYDPQTQFNPYSVQRPYSPSVDPWVAKVPEPPCDLCVTDCEDEACDATNTCTDECFVVPCDDPSHTEIPDCGECSSFSKDNYFGPVIDAIFGVPAASQPVQHHQQQHFTFPPVPQIIQPAPQPDHLHTPSWDAELEAFLCSCGDMLQPVCGAINSPHTQHNHVQPSPSISTADTLYSSFSPTLPSQSTSYGHEDFFNMGHQAVPASPAPEPAPAPVTCLWAGCNAQFGALADLVGHVNLVHLRPAPPTQTQSPARVADTSLSCRWDNCGNYPTAQSLPGPSSGPSLEAALGILSDHLFQDHLGVQPPSHFPPLPSPDAPPPLTGSSSASTSPSLEGTPEAGPADEQSENAVCRWRDCGLAFCSTDDLTAHITSAHVGAGKAHYECFWNECTRNGERGFTSKQKICRHLQSHTGHRPFQCKLCKQHFSEAATLQQHMRRHTQEKPYVCDEPGCGKAFAIAGALTIHKRTHNGDRPFKCTLCDRAFSESSNLSKHLRTHTGVRPYACTAPGCGKTFSRPDQLSRHASVHKK